jgi:hypothetical protein
MSRVNFGSNKNISVINAVWPQQIANQVVDEVFQQGE